jgi:hypothetical protein
VSSDDSLLESESGDADEGKYSLAGRRCVSLSPMIHACKNNCDGVGPSTPPEDDPSLLQRIKHEGSVLSLAVSDDYIFAGTQRKNILVCPEEKLFD